MDKNNGTKTSIVHLGKFFSPERGGIETVTRDLADHQVNAGYDVKVVCFSKGGSEKADWRGVKVWRYRTFATLSSQPLSVGYLLAALRALRSATVLHVHYPNLLASLAVLLRPSSLKVIVHWHSDILGREGVGWLYRPLEQAMLSRADRIICTSHSYSEYSRALVRWQDKVRVIPIGIADYETPTFITKVPHSILFVGRLVEYKGVDLLLKAVANLPMSVRVTIVGDGPKKTQLQSFASELSIEDRVTFIGAVDDTLLNSLFLEAQIFCLPSRSRLEAFGVVLLEAMRASCAVITSDLMGSGVPWVNDSGLKFRNNDYESLRQGLIQMLNNHSTIERLGRAGRSRFESEFLLPKCLDRIDALYREVLN